MKTNARALYLDLMKKALAYALWPEPPIPVETFNYKRPFYQRLQTSALTKILGSKYQLCKKSAITPDQIQEGNYWPLYGDTMIGLKRLDNLQFCVESVIKDGIPGDLIETGVWRGGACIFMRAILAAYDITDRKVYVADSFEGLPKPDSEKYPVDIGDKHHIHSFLAVSLEEVENNFNRYGLLDDQVVFLKGWFKDTLPFAPIEKLAILRLDGDMYGSTMDALINLYQKLSRGGFCIIDDYDIKRCRQAIDDFRGQHGIVEEVKAIDSHSSYWRKEK